MVESLKGKAVSGVIWSSVDRFGQQIIQFVIGVVIARILSPEDYGVVGMTAIFFAVANTLIDSGFGSSLIQNKNRTDVDFSTCFYFNVAIGIIIYGVLFLASPAIAEFYRTPILCDVIRVLGLTMLVNSLMISQLSKMMAEMKFKEMAIISVVTQLVTGAIGLTLAYQGWGIWALVFQQVGSSVVRLLLTQYYLRWVPKLVFSRASFHRMFSYGSKILCSGMINTIYSNVYTLVIGRVYNASDVGYYNRGNQFAQLPAQTLLSVFMNVAFPIMSKVQDDTEKLRAAYCKLIRTPNFVLFPVLTGLIVLSDPLVKVILGDKWLPSVPLLQIICLGYMFEPLTHINLNVLYVKGRTDLVLKLELIKKPIAFVILFLMAHFGVIWLCFGKTLYNFIAYCFNCYYTKRFINLGFWQQMKFNLPLFFNSVVMGGVCLLFKISFSNAYIQLFGGFVVAVITYVIMVIITKDETYLDVKDMFFKKNEKRGPI